MKYKIIAIRSKDIPWSGGTFKKFEVKTDKTGDIILESRLGEKKNPKLKVGDVVEAYVEDSFYTGKKGRVETKILKSISAEYVYKLLLKLSPNIENLPSAEVDSTVVSEPGWDEGEGATGKEEPGF